MANDINAAVEQVNATVTKCLTEVQQTRAKIDAGEARAADLDAKIEKMAAGVAKQDAEIATLQAQQLAQPTITGGDASKRFVSRDGNPLMLDTIVERRIKGSSEPQRIRAEGYLSSAETLTPAQMEAKACWELGVVRAIRQGAIRMDGEGRVSRSAVINAINVHAPQMLDRIALLAESDGLGDADTPARLRRRVGQRQRHDPD
mgnify:FL=1